MLLSAIDTLLQPIIDFVTTVWSGGSSFIEGSADALSSVFLSS